MKQSSFRILIWALLLLVCPRLMQGQSSGIWTQSELFGAILLDLKEGWANPQGKRVTFPWMVEGAEEAGFHKTLIVGTDQDSLLIKRLHPAAKQQDSLYLWIEGISGEVELVINGQYWDVSSCYGGSWVVGIPGKVWLSDRIEIILTISLQTPRPFGPSPILEVNPPVCLLTKEQLDVYRPMQPKVVTQADTVAILPAYYRTRGWDFDPFEALLTLQPILDQGVKTVFFPFPPDRKMLALCAHFGLKEIRTLPDRATVMWAAWYPQAAGMTPIPEAWWLDEAAKRTQFYGVWLEMGGLVQIPVEPRGREHVVYLVLFVLVYLLLLKMIFPGMFGLQMSWILPGGGGSSPGDLLVTLPGSLWLWILSRWLMWSVLITLITLMLRDQGLWLDLRPASTIGIAWHWLSQNSSTWELFIRSVILVTGVDLFRYLLAMTAGIAFGISQFLQSVIRLDLMATFPLVYVLGIPWAASILYPEYGGIGVWIGLAMLLIHIVRLGLSTALGLQQFFGFSGGLIFLYVCSLNLVPYLLLW